MPRIAPYYDQTANLIQKCYGDRVAAEDYDSMCAGKPNEAILDTLHVLLRDTPHLPVRDRIAAQEVMRIQEARAAAWGSPGN